MHIDPTDRFTVNLLPDKLCIIRRFMVGQYRNEMAEHQAVIVPQRKDDLIDMRLVYPVCQGIQCTFVGTFIGHVLQIIVTHDVYIAQPRPTLIFRDGWIVLYPEPVFIDQCIGLLFSAFEHFVNIFAMFLQQFQKFIRFVNFRLHSTEVDFSLFDRSMFKCFKQFDRGIEESISIRFALVKRDPFGRYARFGSYIFQFHHSSFCYFFLISTTLYSTSSP
ncbi:hypothetical protein SUN_1987 [Sulfurovum sp. NBC37-1]|nr:hypothetical protein SUN_1987 [Sulfurovum sp. NBC37-1]